MGGWNLNHNEELTTRKLQSLFCDRTFSCTRYPGSRGSCSSLGWQADAAASACPGKEVNHHNLWQVWKQMLQECDDGQVEANLSRFVEASVPWGFDVREAFLVVRRCCPGRVWSRRGQHHEEGMLGAPVFQEVQRPVSLHGGEEDTKQSLIS